MDYLSSSKKGELPFSGIILRKCSLVQLNEQFGEKNTLVQT